MALGDSFGTQQPSCTPQRPAPRTPTPEPAPSDPVISFNICSELGLLRTSVPTGSTARQCGTGDRGRSPKAKPVGPSGHGAVLV